MPTSRRSFVASLAAAPLASVTLPAARLVRTDIDPERFEPWIEVDAGALRTNVSVLSQLAGKRPLTAVIKNNGYGLGLVEVATVLDGVPGVTRFGVVKVDEALALREAGIRKPILLLALCDDAEGEALVRRGITLSLATPDAARRVALATTRAGRRATGELYIDTGMSRMGLPYHRALPVLRELGAQSGLSVTGTLTELTEDADFDVEQVKRLERLAAEAKAAGLSTGPLHAASSHAVFNHRATLLDAVRPGIAVFGAYPSDDGSERSIARLTVALRLKARVVRVEQLRAGDTVSYGRHFTASGPTWVATIPMGHADGFPRRAVNGGMIRIRDRSFPVIGAVSASHAIVNLGTETDVKIGDVATLLGPDDWSIHPNGLASAAGISVYDVLMHLNPKLPRVVR